ncbi:hypothetical protein HMI54_002285 [Coelomomyces lativittatus]|nr:hypothetical protein HMI56_000950 [Coelomomyces lativittatus]KAJ1508944.1 hypothetical protein HMI55_000156 [Coelomomyces lativittatus]KAJ1509562.1 hypothetical protein HMI54_002285 [Coelomomyces lativittatus]
MSEPASTLPLTCSNLLLQSSQTRYLRLHELKTKLKFPSSHHDGTGKDFSENGDADEALITISDPSNGIELEKKDHYLKLTQLQTIEELSKQLFDAWKAKNEEKSQGNPTEAADMTELAPKKANLDLKRDFSKRLEKVERSMQMAVIELIRQRMNRTAMSNDHENHSSNEEFSNLVEAVDVLYAQH